MTRINIVYQNENMPADVLAPIQAEEQNYTVIWSRTPQPEVDVVVYFNHYAYNQRLHRQTCPQASKVLYMYEPAAVDPVQYTAPVWSQFDAILTWNTYLTRHSDAFVHQPGVYYDLPYTQDYGLPLMTHLPDPRQRDRAICQIASDWYSLAPEELYSLRRRMARWFHGNGVTRMDVYGRHGIITPNYRGSCDKQETLSRYRYSLCLENTYHPQWSHGYCSEKLFDCMAVGVIPIYYGCSNIEEWVPPACYLDFRAFNSWQELDERLQTMSDDEYLQRVTYMRDFFTRYNPPHTHSVYRLYETVAHWYTERDPPSSQPPQWPADYRNLSSGSGRIRLALIRWMLPYHRFFFLLFHMARTVHRCCAGLHPRQRSS